LKRSGDFYSRALGFEVRQMGDPGWRLFDNVDEYHQRARDAGAELTKPLRDEPWGLREFGLRTIDGHRLMVGQVIR